MKLTHTCLLLLPAALLCSACKDSGEFAPDNSPAISRGLLGLGEPGAFAGELHRDAYITPMSPALFLVPSEVNEPSSSYYVCFRIDNLGRENWYDGSKLHYENEEFLNKLRDTDPERVKRILRLYEQRAKQGKPASMINAGNFYQGGYGTAKDAKKAMEYYRMAASQTQEPFLTLQAKHNIQYLKIHDSEFTLAACLDELKNDSVTRELPVPYGENIYLLGTNKAKNEADQAMVREALALILPRDKSGSCHYLTAHYHRHGMMGTPLDEARALQLYHEAASPDFEDDGCHYAKLALGHIFYFGMLGQASDTQKALGYYTRAAATHPNLGITSIAHRARTALAVHSLLQGERGKVFSFSTLRHPERTNKANPQEILKAATIAEDQTAAYNLGIYQLQAAQGQMSADILAQIAGGASCGQPNIEAMVRIYQALHGEGSISEGDIALLRRQDSPAAKTLLANCYATGKGVPRDTGTAFRLYRENQDADPVARYNLSLCYDIGSGVEINGATAAKLRQKALEELRAAAPH